jgi:hypothetical protein
MKFKFESPLLIGGIDEDSLKYIFSENNLFIRHLSQENNSLAILLKNVYEQKLELILNHQNNLEELKIIERTLLKTILEKIEDFLNDRELSRTIFINIDSLGEKNKRLFYRSDESIDFFALIKTDLLYKAIKGTIDKGTYFRIYWVFDADDTVHRGN